MRRKSQNGNAIFMILIAVALFAALGFAFSNSTRTSSSFLTDEEAKAYASQIIAYGNEVRQAVKRLTLRGCSDTEISFENNTAGSYTNPNAPADKSCHVFDGNGGGLQFLKPTGASTNPNFIANLVIEGNGEDCATATCADLILGIRVADAASSEAEKQKGKLICNKINEALGHSTVITTTEIGDDTIGLFSDWGFRGVYNYGGTIDESNIIGKKGYCAQMNANSDLYGFHQILIAR